MGSFGFGASGKLIFVLTDADACAVVHPAERTGKSILRRVVGFLRPTKIVTYKNTFDTQHTLEIIQGCPWISVTNSKER